MPRRTLFAGLLALALAAPAAAERGNPTGWRLFSPCDRNCAVTLYTGPAVEDSMADVLVKAPELPFTWEYRGDDWLVGAAASRHAATLFGRIDLEPEIGLGQRLGRQTQTEAWIALYGRWRGFPWDRWVVTTAALSTGLNYASSVSAVEADRAAPGEGTRLLHFFSPEITFAHPARPDAELVFRFHHRSGVFGLFSEARGGAQYGTFGIRLRF
jgi:hypothetical protein